MDGEDEPFWSVQLTGNADTCRIGNEPALGYEDHALPKGTPVTEHSLAAVLGSEREVSVPIFRGSDRRRNAGCTEEVVGGGGHSSSSSGGSGSGSSRQSLLMMLKLRQVNGGGVMSGVGGDIWWAALLLSAWLLENPQLVQGTRVLELGSGLGLCGIVAGYLSKSVTLTDYVDELLVNLEHNVDINRTPRIDAVEWRGNETSLERLSESQERQQQRQHQQQQEHRGRQRLSRENESILEARPLSPSRVRVRKLDWTAYDHDATEEREEGGEGIRGWWWDDPGPGDDRPGKQEGRGGAEKRAATTTRPSTPEDAGATLRCDVAIGSALVYSPHHACVADVLSRAFAAGGCRAGYILQLSTRPGFDDFLHRLGSCGLRYRLRRMSDVLPGDLLEEIHRSASIDIVGGPVASSRTPSCVDAARDGVGGGKEDRDGGTGVDGGGSPSRSVVAAAAAAAAAAASTCTRFDEFVMCEIFRAAEEQQQRRNS